MKITDQNPGSIHFDTLQIMKFFLILGVVMIHSNVLAGISLNDNTDISHSGIFIMRLIPGAICQVCVPCFFILSGYLYFHNFHNLTFNNYLNKNRRRVKTLLIPYILWNIIGLILLFVKHYYLDIPAYAVINEGKISISGLILGFWNFHHGLPYAFAFWFIRNLIIFVILSPIGYIIGKSKPGFIIFILIIAISNTYLYGFEYFVIGAFIALNRVNIFSLPKILAIISSIICFFLFIAEATWFISHNESTLLIRNAAAFITILYIARCTTSVYVSHPIFRTLVASTFFIYAIHQFFCTITRNFYISIFGLESFTGITLSFLASWLTLVLISIIIWLIIKTISPRTAAILSGGR